MMCTFSIRRDALLEEEVDFCRNRGGSGRSDQSGRGLDWDILPMDSGVVDRCSWAVCKPDDRGDGFVGEGTGLVGTEGGEELKGISFREILAKGYSVLFEIARTKGLRHMSG